MPLINNKNLFGLLPLCAIVFQLTACQQLASIKPGSSETLLAKKSSNEASSTTNNATVAVEAIDSVPEISAELCLEPEDLWSELRNGYQLAGHDHQRVQSDIAWYGRHQTYLDRVTLRAQPYLHMIIEELKARDMPTEIALLPIVESAYQPFAYSHGRAAGLWQFVPGTGKRFGLKQNWWYDGRRDIKASTQAALDYLSYLHRYFDGDWLHAIAAYNSGEGTVRNAIKRNRKKGKPTDFWSLDLPPETWGYVPKLLAIATIVDNPVAHGVMLESIPNESYLTSVDIGSQIDLDLAAELAELTLEDVYRYNPGFNRWATDPTGPHELLLPVAHVEKFEQRLKEYPDQERITWKRHRIREGESLGVIAARYRTSIQLIRDVNDINGNMIRAGKTLTIPVARKDLSRYKLSSTERLKQTQNRKRNGERIEYRVKKGDTLWDIARRYSVNVNSLAKWNGMAPRDPLKPGKRLVIWTEDKSKVSTINPADFIHPFKQNTRQRIGYTVRSGDSLARISQRFRVSIDNVKRWNNLEGEKYLQPGQRLTLYVDVTRQSGSI
jgi:membrane-bound lytic murein transglycosylase D